MLLEAAMDAKVDMDDIGFILASYAVTFGSVAVFAVLSIRRARRAGNDVPPHERPWT